MCVMCADFLLGLALFRVTFGELGGKCSIEVRDCAQ